MIDYTTIREKIETEISDNFTECVVKYENVELEDSTVKEYISVFERQSFGEAVSMDETDFHYGGIIIINIFTELGSGTARARTIAQSLSDLLSSQDIDGLQTQEPELRPGEPNESWYQHNLLIPYTTVTGDENGC